MATSEPNPAVLKELTEKLVRRQNLSAEQTETAVCEILKMDMDEVRKGDGKMLQLLVQISAFLVALRSKGETPEEVFGVVEAMRKRALSVSISEPVLDIVGTGGDGLHTVNISTGASILAAACGIKVAKHGNRSVSSLCGSADVLEQLGVDIEMDPSQTKRCLEEVGVCFFFAPKFHAAMKSVKEMRKLLGIPTVFNLIGPLLNPAGSSHHLVGVYDSEFLDTFAGVLKAAGARRSLIFHGQGGGGGMDELSPCGTAEIAEVDGEGGVKRWTLDPQTVGVSRCTVEDLKGGPPDVNADLLQAALEGKKGAFADCLALNAGAALWVTGGATSLQEGVEKAREALQAKKGLDVLRKWREFSKTTVAERKSASVLMQNGH
uniref:anthranilate phosphoribosyltransferase n=1 Tax=Chromera velia CCMP2878 TaxID=1169474 RepID=A0A0G4HZP9_9ALVE|mmetsp:Transcript_17240/g.34976  ORF Transcript_17240/g.34976 Transcript_17240/m.34976 type:complete len:377 (+) Transcript_17240:98-1228(+)|eukprot:Cvel_1585.t1-p1 / transcript=Cvel_1585.t1 / gene=Cvel_1585 / organism=Chromera_velia_CCMP2878 / gene_product=Anthranilate phosphoribosyltransferase, putative / transcript_product=Anthranilate phosphoribosyltransferase, putative / location=Cvel_scaffold56:117092-121538(+) / protein_length=376 / sequence_SO=supercontig / SO=protein_coding / is_pseudo=false